MTYANAQAGCVTEGGVLATIETLQEWKAMKALVSKYPQCPITDFGVYKYITLS
jgi:hypothetical protein